MNPREHGNPLFNRDGLNLLSTRSRWARVGRYYREAGQWEQDVAAIAQVDASTFETYSHHPAPINDVRYYVDVGNRVSKCAKKKTHEERRILRRELSQLLAEQDRLWMRHGELDDHQKQRWSDLEVEICELKQRLEFGFDELVEPGSNYRPTAKDETMIDTTKQNHRPPETCIWCARAAPYFVKGDGIANYACAGHANAAHIAGLVVRWVNDR